MSFVHLHTHSSYSFLRGLPSPSELAGVAVQYGMQALALTDYQAMTGAVEFYEACQKAGVHPVLGLELSVALPRDLPTASAPCGSLALLAADRSGWRSLCRLSSAVQTESAGEDRPLPFERLAEETEGLICLSGGSRGQAACLLKGGREKAAQAYLNRLSDLFPGRLYVELVMHEPDDAVLCERLADIARRNSLPAAAANNVHFLHPTQARLARLLTAMRLNRPLHDIPEGIFPPAESYFTSPAEMEAKFAAYPGALAATAEIATRCKLELPLGEPHYPEFPVPDGSSAGSILRQKAEAGARRLYGEAGPGIQARLDHELAVIEQAGYSGLFLVMEEILQYARQIGVPHSSRGSAASSLVAHCLGITSPDPLRLNLYFERFLNPARATPPDIDTDLCSRRRDEVIHFVYRRYGAEKVAMVCTINRFRRRSALREVAKAYGLPADEIGALAGSLPSHGWGPPDRNPSRPSPFAELEERYTSPVHRSLFEDAAGILGMPRHLSVHPGGVVIAPGPITDLAPTMVSPKGVVVTQFDLESIERMGLVKIDLLGIRGLTVLGDLARAITQIEAKATDKVDDSPPGAVGPGQVGRSPLYVLESIPEDDADTAGMVRHGRTIGCFQIESPGMRATLKEIQAGSVDDIMAALALYRPGPLTGGLKDAFVRRFRGEEGVTHLHPSLAPLLADTFGVILYQEQVLRIAHELAGLSLADADLLRRAMSHFDPGKQMQALQEKFMSGAKQRSGVPRSVAGRVWEMMAAFAGYGFPKAHAASYAVVAWRAAWCKTHYPALFMASVLANWGGYYGQRVYLTEARRMGLKIRPPHVNHARREFSVSYIDGSPVLFMGLDQVRDLTRRTQRRILKERPFRSLEDFLARVDPRPQEAENLALSGALDGFGSIPALLHRLKSGGWRGGQMLLFPFDGEGAGKAGGDWSLEQKAAAQEVVLGVSVDVHPLELVSGELMGALTTVEAAAQVGRAVRVAGMRQTWRRSRTSRGEFIYFMSLEDLEGMLDVTIPAEVYRRSELKGPGPFLVEGTVEMNHARGEPFIRAERIMRILKE